MINEKLYIENKLVDILPNSISRKLQINDFGEVANRQSNYSNTIKLPKTSNNIKLFDFLGVNGSNSRSPYKKLKCRYVVNGITLISDGYATIKATSEYFEVVVYDGIIDLSERLNGKVLSDLDYEDMNHIINSSTYLDSKNNTEGYVYAIGDFGKPFNSNTIQIDGQVPAIYVHTLFDKILKGVGVTYQGDFFTTNTDYLSEVITPKQGYEVINELPDYEEFGDGSASVVNRFKTSNTYFSLIDKNNISGSFINESPSGITATPTIENDEIVFNEKGRWQFEISINYSNQDTYLQFGVYINNKYIKEYSLNEGDSNKSISLIISVKSGDKLKFQTFGAPTYYDDFENSSNPSTIGYEKYRVNYSVTATFSLKAIVGGQLVDFKTFIGDMKQLDFIKDVMQRYGLILKPIQNQKNRYIFRQFEEILNDRVNGEDWSSKIKSLDKTTYDSGYARKNTASYKYPEEILIPTFNGSFSVNDETIEAEKSLFNSPYEMSVSNRKIQQELVYSVPLYEEKENDGVITIEPKENSYKLFRINRVDKTLTIRFFDEANTSSMVDNIPFLSLNNISLQYYLGNYYKAYQALLNNYSEVEGEALLNNLDIYNLDFFRLKYLSQTGRYYYLNDVQNKVGEVSKIKLIQTNLTTSVNSAPTQLGVFNLSMGYKNERLITITNITENSNPVYFDPEFDEPLKIKITGGFNSKVQMKNGEQIINTETEILVENMNLRVVDLGTSTDAHSESFTFKIADEGSGEYSNVEGTIQVNVREYTNTPPTARAGNDASYNIKIADDRPYYYFNLDGSISYDSTGDIISYQWLTISKPSISNAYVSNLSNDVATFVVPNEEQSGGSYTMQLKVTDEFGVTDTDVVNIQIYIDRKPIGA
ncbi:PKD domain-containing protein [Leeuwenhoekiella sp. NPDC079379]|uniref:PKD domain-containing protein n=1 Tax=Leeuwenhoekiella sp. NPDC079379 TaxID=3364122 RepID=UPI0037C6DEC1